MTNAEMMCPKCNGEMVEGYVMDNAHLFFQVNQWIKGRPQKARATFGILPTPGIHPPKTEEMIPIGTFRCHSCGFLEMYARDEFALK